MPYPSKYARGYGFANFQESHPQSPLPGSQVDTEMDAAAASSGEVVEFIKRFARSDGRLANGSVGVDQLAADLSIGFKAPTTWETGIGYGVSDTVFYLSGFYTCAVAHVSGSVFEPENWTLVFDLGYGALLGSVTAAAGFFNKPVASVITALPESPAEGARHLVAHSGTAGALVGKEDQVAQYADSQWSYSGTPADGQPVYVQATKLVYRYASGYGFKPTNSKHVWLSWFVTSAGVYDYATADTFAAAASRALYIDEDIDVSAIGASGVTFTANVRMRGGVITRGTKTITFSAGWSADPNDVCFDAAGTGAISFTGRTGEICAKNFGVAGDDSTNDAVPLAAFLTALGSGNAEAAIVGPRLGRLLAGRHRFTGTFAVPAHAVVKGVKNNTVLRPTSAANVAVTLATGATLEGVCLLGDLSTGASVGVQIGGAGADVNRPQLKDVQIQQFTGAGAIGLSVRQVVTAMFDDVVVDGCTQNIKVQHTTDGYPSNLVFNRLSSRASAGNGIDILSGQAIKLNDPLLESNQGYGLYIDDAGTRYLEDVVVTRYYVEVNQQGLAADGTRQAAYNCYIRGTRVTLADSRTQLDSSNGPLAVKWVNALDAVLRNPALVNSGNDNFYFSGTTTATVSEWPNTNGSIDTVIKADDWDKIRLQYDIRDDFTPVITCATPGDLAVVWTTRAARYYRSGKSVRYAYELQADITHSTASGQIRLTGGPFTRRNADGTGGGGVVASFQGINTAADFTQIMLVVPKAASYATLVGSKDATAAAAIAITEIASGSTFIVTGSVEFEVA